MRGDSHRSLRATMSRPLKELGMDLRLTLYELTARHGLSADGAAQLADAAGLQQPPKDLARRVAQGVALLAAAARRPRHYFS